MSRKFFADDRGLETVEYAIITGMIVTGLIAVVVAIGTWIKGKFDPNSGLFVHSQTMTMMMVWFFLCLFKFIPNVANTAHAVGLGIGLTAGYISSVISNARR